MSDPTPNPNPNPAPNPTPQPWTASLDADLQGYVTTKGFKEPKDVVESYRNFEKLQGVPKERLLALPESLEGDAMNPVWERLGAVKEAKEYKFEIPKDHADEKFGEWTKEVFHKLKVPRSMAEKFAEEFNARQAAGLTEQQASLQARVQEEHNSLKKEWGGAYEQNESIANQAAQKFGLIKEDIEALGASMGPYKAMKFLHKLGQGIGEAPFVTNGQPGNQVPTPQQAQNEIKSLIKDTDFSRRLRAGDVDAKNKWDRLHKFAFQGEVSI